MGSGVEGRFPYAGDIRFRTSRLPWITTITLWAGLPSLQIHLPCSPVDIVGSTVSARLLALLSD